MANTSLGDIQARRKRVLGYLPNRGTQVHAEIMADCIWRKRGGRPSDSLALAVAITLEESRPHAHSAQS